MKYLAIFAAVSLLAASPALADGRLGALAPGSFTCELPGDAAGAVGHPQPQESFTVTGASRYESRRGGGTYLFTSGQLEMTSGPLKGNVYRVESGSFLRKLDGAGKPTRLRCVRG